ncbi:DUF2939 domain-containing protein [Acidisphaera rubrifaciens]|uniref:DUF2939 domain-containing protein n=1 Tax=Acidisphaera rubrifaciens HS-AP3 TaxID=1231350 RepID=A0A0D6P5Q5_9PROT|nr:DUF2939 domain-containing protein [Acidisphaera rubrifaciens]GAN76538.1 hypothetical protein Asru_0112_02 [Acidisphaera rubrifaciens HS-AP3]
MGRSRIATRAYTRKVLRRVLPICVAVASVYALLPYVVLYQLGQAVRHGDAATLGRLVAWDDVREGLKEDVCDEMVDAPAPNTVADNTVAGHTETVAQGVGPSAPQGGGLKPFGFSFVRGVAGNMIDANVTPDGLVSAAHRAGLDQPATGGRDLVAEDAPRIVWAFFDGPTAFSVWLQPHDPSIGPIHIRLEMHDFHWQVVRAWLPRTLLARANERT